MTGSLEAIWIKRFRRGPMEAVREATLVADRGIVGNANQGGRRQVTVLEAEAWEEMTGLLGSRLGPSARRANLLVRGVPLRDGRGQTLHIGDCRIHVLGETRPCERMEETLPGLRRAMGAPWRGGAFGVVLDDGVIRVGDRVELRPPTWTGLDPAPPSRRTIGR